MMADSTRIMNLQETLLSLRIADWNDKVISFQYFFLVVLLILPWVIWWKVADRKRITEIFAFGLLISVISSFLNGNGLNLLLWSYPYSLLPSSERAYVFSLSALPVAFMIIYQYYPRLMRFGIATLIFSAFMAFVVQPILSLLDLYKLNNWNYFYSFLSLLFLSLVSKLIHQKVLHRGYNIRANDSDEVLNRADSLAPAFKMFRDDKDYDNK
ncbi:MAG: hypothetical protein PHE26_08565 [Syntrophomonadaceae bacterium]|nr:hypothetical protein [Syntrophomonadaceae bacterium]